MSEEEKKNEDKKEESTGELEGEIPKVAGELEVCRKEREEYLNGWRRAKADLENYKKEEMARAEMVIKFANESLLGELTSIVDSFDLAIKAEPDSHGTRLIRDQLAKILSKYGLAEIKAEAGQKFDPKEHEAVETVEIKEGEETGIIAEVIGGGWKLYDTVLKPVRVKVLK